MTPLHRIASLMATAAGLGLIGAISQWPMSITDDHATIRLSWRTAPIRIEACRTLTEEELSKIAPHMRRAQECTGAYADYRLSVALEGLEPVVDTVSPSGLRHDRPVYVFVDRPVPPGTYRVSVDFAPIVPEGLTVEGAAPLVWDGTLRLGPREVGLITLDGNGRRLIRALPNGGASP